MSLKIYSKVFGEGKPLIVLHGLFGMSDNWQTLGKRWADEGFNVHILDQRNHGQTENTYEFSYQLMADDLMNYMDENGIESASILGHSMGGKVAMLFATQNPDRVEDLIVVDIAPKGYPVHHQEILHGLHSLDFSKISSRTEADDELAKSLPNASVRQFLLKSLYWVEKGKLGYRFNLESITDHIEMVGEALLESAVYNGPTLFIKGENSGYIVEDDMPMIKRHFPNAELISAKAGHWVHAEQPELIFTEVLKMIR